jgi:hypothetical protein
MTDDQSREPDNNLAQFPPLTISDLIVLTLSVACVFGCVSSEIRDALKLPSFGLKQIASEFVLCFAIGVALFGLIVLGRERLRRRESPSSPGHWILVAVGPYSILLLVRSVCDRILLTGRNDMQIFVIVCDTILSLVLVASIIWSVRAVRTLEIQWQLVL